MPVRPQIVWKTTGPENTPFHRDEFRFLGSTCVRSKLLERVGNGFQTAMREAICLQNTVEPERSLGPTIGLFQLQSEGPSQANVLAHVLPGWWHCFGRLQLAAASRSPRGEAWLLHLPLVLV